MLIERAIDLRDMLRSFYSMAIFTNKIIYFNENGYN